MQVTFDTASLGPEEARGLIALLTTLAPVALGLSPATGAMSTIYGAQIADQQTQLQRAHSETLGEAAQAARESQIAQSESQPETSDSPAPARRGRKPKSIETPPAAPTETAPSTETSPTTESKPNGKAVTADELRGLLNGYISRHTMDEAIAKLRAFGCQRVTEAFALPPDQLSALAGELNA